MADTLCGLQNFLRHYQHGFLYNMVRIITAQAIKSARGDADMRELLAARDRSQAKELAPACGLYLYKVDYGE